MLVYAVFSSRALPSLPHTLHQFASTPPIRMVIEQLADNQPEYPMAFNTLRLCKLNLTRHRPCGSKSFQQGWTHRTDLLPNSSESPQTFQMSIWATVFLPLSLSIILLNEKGRHWKSIKKWRCYHWPWTPSSSSSFFRTATWARIDLQPPRSFL